MKRKYPYNHEKNARIHLRTSSEIKREIKEKAEFLSMNLGEFMLHASLDVEIPEPLSSVSKDAVRELSRIGNNLNQLTAISHRIAKEKTSDDEELKDLLNDTRNVIRQVGGLLIQLRGDIYDL